MAKGSTRRAFLRGLAAGAGAACLAGPLGCTGRTVKRQGRFERVIVLGIDGLDPGIVGEGIREGRFPAFARLAARGGLRPLATSTPAQSPVAWTALATGANPGAFGIFDFLDRDPERYLPRLAVTRAKAGTTEFQRPHTTPTFWERAADAGIAATAVHWPVTFPPRRGPERVLAGLGVPDISGAVGRYTFYTARGAAARGRRREKGRIVELAFEGGEARSSVWGPRVTRLGGTREAEVPIRFAVDRGKGAVRIHGPDGGATVAAGSWSPWMRFRFKVGILRRVTGMGRFLVLGLDPPAIYLTPIQVDPRDPAYPISNPAGYARELARAVGDYYTQGLPEDTNALKDGRIDETAFLSICDEVVSEGERMLERELGRFRDGLLAFVFFTTDRIQHIFWVTRDPSHPAYDPAYAKRYGDVIPSYYGRMDAALARVLRAVDDATLLLVCSDHGFASFRRAFHVNRWLLEHGYQAIADGKDPEAELFRSTDWSRTSAYALGFAGIYLNVRGREGRGIVVPGEAGALADEIRGKLLALRDPADGERVVASAERAGEIYRGPHVGAAPDLVLGLAPGYRFSWQTALGAAPARLFEDNRDKWTGDHLVDPASVPGIVLSSEAVPIEKPTVLDLAPTVLDALGLERPGEVEGRSLLPAVGGGKAGGGRARG